MASWHTMLIKVHWLNSPLIQATLHTHLEEKKKKKDKCSQSSRWNQSSYYLLSIKCLMWTTHQTFTAKTTCQTETSKVLVDEGYQYFLYSSRAYYFYLDLFENTKVLGSELHIITTKTTFIHDNKCIFFLVYSSLCLMQLFIRVRENNALTALAY